MATNVRAVNLTDFTAGLNLRGDAFELSDGESPDMLNVDLDTRGGFVARKGWVAWNTASIDASWDPRTLFVHELADGTDRVYVANNSKVRRTTDGVTWTLLASGTDIAATAAPHGADFAPWGDTLYVACGKGNQSAKVASTLTVTRQTKAQAATFTAYTAPSSNTMPQAEFMAAHGGYMFAAFTNEDAVDYPSRLRWSHPNNPEAWLAADYIDILEGGGPITGLMPMRDHLLVFKQSSVWALFGYDSDSWQLVNVSREKGALHRQGIARSESAVFFYCHLDGIYAISDGSTPREMTPQLRPMFPSGDFVSALADDVWLGWVGQRLWLAVPFDATAVATDATAVFVFDPAVGENGAWVRYESALGGGMGPFAQGGFGGGSGLKLGCYRAYANVLKLEATDVASDTVAGVTTGFESYFVTRWIDGGAPTLKKSWRRPDFVMKERSSEYTATVTVFRDYDESDAVREKVITVDAGGSGALWGSFTYGDGTVYGPEAKGSTIERGGNLGPARAVQLRITGGLSTTWGVDAIIFKFVPRRLR